MVCTPALLQLWSVVHTKICLSHLPLPACEDADSTIWTWYGGTTFCWTVCTVIGGVVQRMRCLPWTNSTVAKLLTGWPKKKTNLKHELASYFHVRDELAVQDNLVFRGSYRLVVPISLCGALIHLALQGHQGIAWHGPLSPNNLLMPPLPKAKVPKHIRLSFSPYHSLLVHRGKMLD